MRRNAVFVVLAVAVGPILLSGCLGSGSEATIPSSELSSRGWRLSSSGTESAAGGLVELFQAEYSPGGGGPLGGASAALGGLIVVVSPKVPLIDEARFIPPAISQIEENEGVEFIPLEGDAFKEDVETAQGATAEAWNYNVKKTGVTARAQVLHWECPDSGDFVVAAGYGVVGATFEDARALARVVEC